MKKKGTLTQKRKEFKELTKQYKTLVRKINKNISEHNSYRIAGGEESIMAWIESLPLNSLSDFGIYERGQLPDRLTLPKLVRKGKLMKKYVNDMEELEHIWRKRKIVEIELLQEKINKVNETVD